MLQNLTDPPQPAARKLLNSGLKSFRTDPLSSLSRRNCISGESYRKCLPGLGNACAQNRNTVNKRLKTDR